MIVGTKLDALPHLPQELAAQFFLMAIDPLGHFARQHRGRPRVGGITLSLCTPT